VLHGRAGSSPARFANSPYPRDCDEHGVRRDRTAGDGGGMRLSDFASLPDARSVGLSEAHVLALRLYTTAAYQSINAPLRDAARTAEHPFPATVFLLEQALKKLRAARLHRAEHAADGEATQPLVLYRGMRYMDVPESFRAKGGTEAAPMSTTSSLNVAVRYALSRHSLLLRITAPSFMHAGASLGFLSAFPAEEEYLYPPGTYLRPTGVEQTFELEDDGIARVVEVEPAL
jgi:hypothetical protein